MSHLFVNIIVHRMKENKSQKSKPITNQQIKGEKHMKKKCEQKLRI